MSAMEQTVAFGPHFMTLDQELLRVLTAGDAARLEELLRRQDQTHSHVAVNVQAAAAPPGAVAAPPWQGASCLLLGVTSNGALHLAASRGHAELAALRCERAPSLVATRNRGLDTPLHCAAKAGHRGVVARLLSAMRAGGEALCARNCLSATALFEAVRHGHAAVVDLLMVLAPELASVATNSGVSPLYLAATTDSLQMEANFQPGMAQEMLAWEPEGPSLLSRVDSSGRTPLHFAALYGRLDVVQLFLAVPTSVELAHIADSHGQFPLHAAAMKGNTRVLDELMKKCPDHHELVDDKGRNLLHCAVEHNQRAVVRHVCQDGNLYMLLNAMDYEGNSPLHLAAKYRFIRIVSILLLTMTVETSITNKDGLTAGDRLPCVD
uniref:Uncharacterized protein n=1 Tax=Setaria italica TaxID=4555 RepID=K4A228_SETIT